MFTRSLKWLDSLAIALLFSAATVTHASNALQPRFYSDPDAIEVTIASQFYERYYHKSIILGDYLYIDGGQVVFQHNDSVLDYQPGMLRVAANNTYSIDLSKSWTNQSVVLNSISKTAPVVNGEVLWADESGSTFYAWGGALSDQYTITDASQLPVNAIWQFFPNGNSGAWNQLTPDGNGLEKLVRPKYGAGAYGKGVGYQYGGFIDGDDAVGLINTTTQLPIPGIISYEFRNNKWTNTSAPNDGTSSQRYNSMQFVDNFGSGGLLVAFGGGTYGIYGITSEIDSLPQVPLSSLSKIDVFDPSSGKWYSQSTSGPTPAPRAEFCSLGVAGDNGTFEIFIHGGQKFDEDTVSLDEIFVLSLPAFTWQRAKYPAAHPRSSHTCNARKNQMIIVGGYVADQSNKTNDYPKDPWPLGLAVFDMTNLVFQDKYNADAPDYTTPQVIKDYYNANGLYPSWDDQGLAHLFVTSTNATSNTTVPASPATTDDSSGSSSHTGAIAGGVVGGVVGLALVGVLAWWLTRRRKNTNQYQAAQVTDNHQTATGPEKDYNEQVVMDQARKSTMPHSPGLQSPELNGGGFGTQQPYHEVHAQDIRHEVDGQGMKHGGDAAHELQ